MGRLRQTKERFVIRFESKVQSANQKSRHVVKILRPFSSQTYGRLFRIGYSASVVKLHLYRPVNDIFFVPALQALYKQIPLLHAGENYVLVQNSEGYVVECVRNSKNGVN